MDGWVGGMGDGCLRDEKRGCFGWKGGCCFLL